MKQATLFSLILDKGGKEQYSFALNVASDAERLSSVPGYDQYDYSKPKTGDTVWTLDGWYNSKIKGDNWTKVLNADGTVACESLRGVIEDGKFAQRGRMTLYARWTTTKSGWVPSTGTSVLKADDSKQYLLVSSVTPGDTAAVLFQDGTRDISTQGSGVYLSDDFYALQLGHSGNSEGYIEGAFSDKYLWKPTGITLANEPVVGLANKDSGYFLTENGNNAADKWTVTATPDGSIKPKTDNNKLQTWKRVKITRDKNWFLKVGTGTLSYFADKPSPLALGDARKIYLYEQSNNIEVESFCFGPELKLFNGDKKEVSLAYSSPLTKVPGADLKSSGWELIGWFDSKSKKAKKILDSDGSVVGGKSLEWSDDLCLYAKWRQSSKVKRCVKVDKPSMLERYAFVDCIGALQFDKNKPNMVTWTTVNVGNNTLIYEDGSHPDSLGSSNPHDWQVTESEKRAFTISRKDGKDTYYLGWETVSETVSGESGTTVPKTVLKASKDYSEGSEPRWTIVEDAGESFLAAIDDNDAICGYMTFVHSNDGGKWEYVYNGTWCLVEKNEAQPITFYQYNNSLYCFSWDRK